MFGTGRTFITAVTALLGLSRNSGGPGGSGPGGGGPGGTPPEPGEGYCMQRATPGLLFADDFNRPDGLLENGWDLIAGSFTIEEGRAVALEQPSVAHRSEIHRADAIVHAIVRLSAHGSVRLYARRGSDNTYGARIYRDNTLRLVQLFKLVDGDYSTIAQVTTPIDAHTDYALKLEVTGNTQRVWLDGMHMISASDSTLSGMAGSVVMGPDSVGVVDDFVACAGNMITVTGLPAGYQIRAGDLTASEVGGAATLDCEGRLFPFATVEVVDPYGLVVAAFSEVYGGDQLEYTCGLATYGAERTELGLLFWDDFNRPDGPIGNGWASSDAIIVGGEVRVGEAATSVGSYRPEVALVNGVVQARFRTNRADEEANPQLVTWIRYNGADRYDLGLYGPNAGGGQRSELTVRTASQTYFGVVKQYWNYPTGQFVQSKIEFGPSKQQMWHDGVLRVSATDSRFNSHPPSPVGFWLSESNNPSALQTALDDYIVCASNAVTCTHLPAGWKLRAAGNTAAETGGTATVDVGGATFPLTSVEILDASDALVHTISPAGGVWGGDSYRLTISN